MTERTGADVPVAGADVSASDTRVAGAGEELALTEGEGETTAFTVVVALCVGDVALDDPAPPDDAGVGTDAEADTFGVEADPGTAEAGVGTVGAATVGVEDFVLGGEAEFETGVVGEALTEAAACPDVEGRELVVGAETDAAPAAPAPDSAKDVANTTQILLRPPIIRNVSNIRP